MKLKLTMLLGLLVVASLVLSACGGAAAPTQAPATEAPAATQAPATEAPTEVATEAPAAEPAAALKIWADDTRTPLLQELAPDFLSQYNVELNVEDLGKVQDIRSQVILAVPAGEGPDIYLCVHDWLGALVESGLVAPVDLGATKDKFVQSNLDAFTYTDGKLYGLPYSSENLGFFYNTDLVKEPPTTWAEVLDIGRQLKKDGKAEYAFAVATGPLYNALPVQTAMGGYIFGKDANGAWNPDDVGLDSEGEIKAVTFMADAAKEGLMPNTFDYETAHSLFETGKIPFLMAGPWALDRIRASKVPYAVAPAFPDNGAPFLGVQGFCVNPLSKNQLLAQAFLTEFVATDDFMQKIADSGLRPSSFKSVLEKTSDPDLKAMGQAGADAMPMPNIPEMGSVWTAADNGITLAVTGEQTPEQAMKDAATQVRSLISGAYADMVNIPGSYQKKAGCGADWDPACPKTAMTKGDDGKYTLTVQIPAGDYEYKVAMAGAWTESYGSDGTSGGGNYTLSLPADSKVTFTYDPETHMVTTATE
jgi:arabinogalactan oligomer / maltooligosaccharide transport system substrate-binding protein